MCSVNETHSCCVGGRGAERAHAGPIVNAHAEALAHNLMCLDAGLLLRETSSISSRASSRFTCLFRCMSTPAAVSSECALPLFVATSAFPLPFFSAALSPPPARSLPLRAHARSRVRALSHRHDVQNPDHCFFDLMIPFASGPGKMGVICWTVTSDEAGLRKVVS